MQVPYSNGILPHNLKTTAGMKSCLRPVIERDYPPPGYFTFETRQSGITYGLKYFNSR